MSSPPLPLLAVDDLVVSYGQLVALHGVDVAVPEGSVVALLGPNGAGKSSLLNAVAGLAPVRSGSIRLRGEELVGEPAFEVARRGVCLVPGGWGVFPTLTVAENLMLSLEDDEEAVERVFDYLPVLRQRREQVAGTLSGGEQQMLALARAIGLRPALLMADELSLGLAPMLVRTIADALQRLKEEERRTILVVEQYANHALRLADFVYILAQGRLVWAGEPQELRHSEVLVESYLGTAV